MKLSSMVHQVSSRMEESARQAVRNAIKEGATVLMCGKYSEAGMLVLRVSKPARWTSESWARCTAVTCTIPAAQEAATLAWAQRKMAQQG